MGILSVLFLFQLVKFIQGACTDGWEEFGQSCYHFSNDKETWIQAYTWCEHWNSNLVEINDEAEQMFIHNRTMVLNHQYWLGSSDTNKEGKWVWETSGTDVLTQSYQNWRPGEPNNSHGTENCLEIKTDGTWNDDDCDEHERYICEKPSGAPVILG